MTETIGRRDALKIAAVGMAAALQAADNKYAVKSSHPPFGGLKVGFTSYSTRKLTLPQTLAEAQRLHRPSREIQALTNSNTKIVALALGDLLDG